MQCEIVNSDIIEYITKIADNSVDLIIADPPYFQIKGEFDFGVFKDKNEYLNWCKKWLIESKRILKDTGSMILWGSVGNREITFARLAIMIEDEKYFFAQKLDNATQYSWNRHKNKLYVGKGRFFVFD
ncbi:hypothetical protein ELQ15_08400 [Campylobacter sp. US12a]|uniref:DNA methyltransferase n=1 Tax=Campylobacter sp. US12a TaxID=2498116 RepID=UPI001067EA4B|nr:DNA methyltransferase [Campylobacter sp. US12a]TEY04404.1 hypothetical protein ELQ15_08400 [Campylobacter sp. US12a]